MGLEVWGAYEAEVALPLRAEIIDHSMYGALLFDGYSVR